MIGPVIMAAFVLVVPAVLVLGGLAVVALTVAALATTPSGDGRAAVVRPLPLPTR